MPRSRPRGYTLISVVFILALLAGALGVLLASIRASSEVTGDIARRQAAFYACDGVSRALVTSIKSYTGQDSTPTSSEMRAYLCAQIGPCAPGDELQALLPDYTITQFNISPIGTSAAGQIPSGPFEGMNAQLQTVSADFRAVSEHGQVCRMSETFTIGQIALFQFAAFAENSLDLVRCAPTRVLGRVHVNGEFCGGCNSSTNGWIQRLTASGHAHQISNCSRYTGSASRRIYFDNASGTATQLLSSADSSNAVNWKDYAITRFGGNVQDQAHAVPALRVPFTAQPDMQDSVHSGIVSMGPALGNGTSDGKTVFDNSTSMRFFIDPVAPGEPQSTSDERLAMKADIRIIDGVWFVRETGTPWPGRPIWSDHPGEHVTVKLSHSSGQDYMPAGLAVGRKNIADAESWGSSYTPRMYSYYETEPDGTGNPMDTRTDLLEGMGDLPGFTASTYVDTNVNSGNINTLDNTGVLSYGTVTATNRTATDVWRNEPSGGVNDGTRTFNVWMPSYWIDNDNTQIFGPLRFLTGDSWMRTARSNALRNPSNVAISASGAYPYNIQYLQGTRGGFVDGRIRARRRNMAGHILPINVDVEQLARALARCESGEFELGNYFPETCLKAGGSGNAASGRSNIEFNGIIWVGSRWPNQMASPTGGSRVPLWPHQRTGNRMASTFTSTLGTVSQPNIDGSSGTSDLEDRLNRALPAPLCSDDLDGQSFAAAPSGAVPFKIPTCMTGSSTNPSVAIPNGVRVINARRIHHEIFEHGLTISTHIPVYQLGNVNNFSLRSTSFDGSFSGTDEWVPMLIAGDAMSSQSENWDDLRSYWTEQNESGSAGEYQYHNGATGNRSAVNTNWVTSIFAGNVWPHSESAATGGLQNWPRFMEAWGGSKYCRIDGSMVMGFGSVYANDEFLYNKGVFTACNRRFTFDTNLRLISNQPPGAPYFTVSAIRQWAEQ